MTAVDRLRADLVSAMKAQTEHARTDRDPSVVRALSTIATLDPIAESLSFYGSPSDCAALPWSWVDHELTRAGTYWVVPRTASAPHPRPVWGVWLDRQLLLSIGSAVVARQLGDDPTTTVHLESGTDVVIVEGRVEGDSAAPDAVAAYDQKYDWSYTVDEYGPLIVVVPNIVLAWRSAGWAGRDGFQAAGRWRFT